MNITGAFHIRHCASSGNPAMVANEQIGALKGEGFDMNFSNWSNGISMQSWSYHPEKVTFDASRNWTGETSSFGKASPDAIDVKGAVRRVYIYYRQS